MQERGKHFGVLMELYIHQNILLHNYAQTCNIKHWYTIGTPLVHHWYNIGITGQHYY